MRVAALVCLLPMLLAEAPAATDRSTAAPAGSTTISLAGSPVPSASSAPASPQRWIVIGQEYDDRTTGPSPVCAPGGELVGQLRCVATSCPEGTYYDSSRGCLPIKPPEECMMWRPYIQPDSRGPRFVKREPDCPCYGHCLFECSGPVRPLALEALESCKKVCSAGNGHVCGRIGATYGSGLSRKPDLELARLYLNQACLLGDGRSCVLLGSALESGGLWPKDEGAARVALEKGCSRKAGCWHFAKFLSKGSPSPEDTARAHAIYVEDCKKWHDGCAEVVPEMRTSALRCCELAKARLHPGPWDLIKFAKLADCFGEAKRRDADKRVRALVRDALGTELVPECEALGEKQPQKPPVPRRFEDAPTQ